MAKKLRSITVNQGGVKVEIKPQEQRAAITLDLTYAEDLKLSTMGVSMLVEGGKARRMVSWDTIVTLIADRGLRYVPDSIKRKKVGSRAMRL